MEDEFSRFASRYEDPAVAMRGFARQLYSKGRFHEAADYQIQAINAEVRRGVRRSSDYVQAAFYIYALRDYRAAALLLRQGCDLDPHNLSAKSDLGFMLYRSGDEAGALACLREVTATAPEYIPALDALAEIYAKRGDTEAMRRYGEKSLRLKDDAAHEPSNLVRMRAWVESHQFPSELPPFDASRPGRNVIAFSLWGAEARFNHGAVSNARLARYIYPGWMCRFYVDPTVPSRTLETLGAAGAQIQEMPESERAYDGLFWRFLVSDDREVDRFLIRDCDSVITCQERVAVDQWLASDKAFHVMRDNCTHTELIMAGMWGGVRGFLPTLAPIIEEFCKSATIERTIDQQFLRRCVWPLVKPRHLAHDSHFRFCGSKDFPELGRNPPGRHIGMNENLAGDASSAS